MHFVPIGNQLIIGHKEIESQEKSWTKTTIRFHTGSLYKYIAQNLKRNGRNVFFDSRAEIIYSIKCVILRLRLG